MLDARLVELQNETDASSKCNKASLISASTNLYIPTPLIPRSHCDPSPETKLTAAYRDGSHSSARRSTRQCRRSLIGCSRSGVPASRLQFQQRKTSCSNSRPSSSRSTPSRTRQNKISAIPVLLRTGIPTATFITPLPLPSDAPVM